METRTLRRYSGSAVAAPKSTPSTPMPAALRKMDPMFSWSPTPSKITRVRAPSSTSATESGSGLSAETSSPRCMSYPATSPMMPRVIW